MIDLDLNGAFWHKYFRVYDILNKAIPYQELMETICDELKPQPNDLILDAGAGTCNLSTRLSDSGASVIALDSSKVGLEICKQKSDNIDTVLHDLVNPLPFKDNYFDKVVSNNVIHLLSDNARQNMVGELHRVLKPGGVCVISSVHTNFSPLKIYKNHIYLYKKKYGTTPLLINIATLLYPTIKMFYYNTIVKKSHHSGEITRFITREELSSLFKMVNFQNISNEKEVYANQSYICKAIK